MRADISTRLEYGTEEVLDSWPNGNYINKPVRTDPTPSPTEFHNDFTWNSTDGFTISLDHEHPDISAPSPADVFLIAYYLKDTELQNAGTSAVDFYKQNISIKVVVANATYIVTVNNWQTLTSMADAYYASQQGHDDAITAYQNATTQHADYDAGFLAYFGDAVNLYKADAGSTNFVPLKLLDSRNSSLATSINCPQTLNTK